MHCGGKTVHADHVESLESIVSQDYEPVGPSSSGSTIGAIDRTGLPSPGPAKQSTDSLFSLPEFGSDGREIEESEEGSKSIGQTIIRGLGGFVWVIVLIGFTLARNCGGD